MIKIYNNQLDDKFICNNCNSKMYRDGNFIWCSKCENYSYEYNDTWKQCLKNKLILDEKNIIDNAKLKFDIIYKENQLKNELLKFNIEISNKRNKQLKFIL